MTWEVCGKHGKTAGFDLKVPHEMQKSPIQVTCDNVLFQQRANFVLSQYK